VGGHSYGGRQASILASEEPGLADALLLLSYPLHPPKKPASLRTSHFPTLRTSALVAHGTRDPFGTIEELSKALALIPAATRLVTIESGHDLLRGNFDVPKIIVQPFRDTLSA
jgi:predicted alpha/beta-hydrolase family hydrolase